MSNVEIEEQILEQEKRSYDFEPMRVILGALMAASFSMIIFLLTFVQNRNLLLEICIFLLLLSLILLMDLFLSSVRIQTKIQQAKTPKELFKQRKKILGYMYFGINLFKCGLLFLTFFFDLYIISIIFFIYLFYKSIWEISESIKTLRDFNKEKETKYAIIITSPLLTSFINKLKFDVTIHGLNLILLILILIWILDYFY